MIQNLLFLLFLFSFNMYAALPMSSGLFFEDHSRIIVRDTHNNDYNAVDFNQYTYSNYIASEPIMIRRIKELDIFDECNDALQPVNNCLKINQCVTKISGFRMLAASICCFILHGTPEGLAILSCCI